MRTLRTSELDEPPLTRCVDRRFVLQSAELAIRERLRRQLSPGEQMLDHIGFYCRDAKISLPFYRTCLAPLGIVVIQEQPHLNAAIFKREGSPAFWWLGEGGPDWSAQAGRSRVHLGFAAASAAEVDAFHAAARTAGGLDNGLPGYRRPTCYSAFALDPDGNNVEAIWQTERS